MKVLSFKKVDKNKATVEILIDRGEFDKKLNIVWNRQKKWINLPGFRKGKVPRVVIENEYGKNVFHADALRLLYPEMIDLLSKETNENIFFLKEEIYMSINADSKPSEVIDSEEGIMTKFSLDLYPELEINTDFTVELEPKKVASEDEIEHQIDLMVKQNGWKSMGAETPVELHDKVRLNIQKLESVDNDPADPFKRPIEIEDINGLKYCLGGDDINPDMPKLNEALIGHNMKEGTIELSELDFPADLPNKKFAGRKVKALLELVAVKRRYTTEELAKRMNLESEDDLYDYMEKQINGYYESVYENQKDPKVVEKLLEQVPDDILPKDLLEASKSSILHQLHHVPAYSNYAPEQLEEMAESHAKSQLKTEIALFNVARNEKMEVTQQMKDSMRAQLSQNMSKDEVDRIPETEIEKLQLETQALQSIKSKVKFVDKENTGGESDSEQIEEQDAEMQGEVQDKVDFSEEAEDRLLSELANSEDNEELPSESESD